MTPDPQPELEAARQIANDRLRKLVGNNFGLTNADNGISDVHFPITVTTQSNE